MTSDSVKRIGIAAWQVTQANKATHSALRAHTDVLGALQHGPTSAGGVELWRVSLDGGVVHPSSDLVNEGRLRDRYVDLHGHSVTYLWGLTGNDAHDVLIRFAGWCAQRAVAEAGRAVDCTPRTLVDCVDGARKYLEGAIKRDEARALRNATKPFREGEWRRHAFAASFASDAADYGGSPEHFPWGAADTARLALAHAAAPQGTDAWHFALKRANSELSLKLEEMVVAEARRLDLKDLVV